MFKQVSIAAIALGASLTMSANAGTIPYPDKGTIPPAHSFTATTDGSLTAYFYDEWASLDSWLNVWINGDQFLGGYKLKSSTSAFGEYVDFGPVSAGDTLVFELKVEGATQDWNWYSDPSKNGGLNYVYTTDFAGDAPIPAGTYISFEDLPNLGDVDFNDYQFVVSNVTAHTVPEPFSLVLFGLGIAALGFARKRKA